MNLTNIIHNLPYTVKQPLKYIYSVLPEQWRLGKTFWETYNFLQESQWWSREKLEHYQIQKLGNLLEHAYRHVLYYRTIFDERGLKPRDIQNIHDLKNLPVLTKDTFRTNLLNNSIIAKNIKKSALTPCTTSGTTGKPLQFYENKDSDAYEWAFMCHQWSRMGYKPGDKRIEIRGKINRIKPVSYDPMRNFLRLSPVIENKKQAAYYLEKISKFGAEFIHGYPGAIASFALLIRQYNLNIQFQLKAVFFASEIVYKWQREIVEKVFQCRVFSHYGCSEKTVLAAECEKGDGYHCVPQYGITEFDPATYEIIATGFINVATPFIRYKMTDVALNPVYGGCPLCARNYFPIIERIEGRLEDFIVTPEGTLISPAILTHPFKNLKSIRNTQIIQLKQDLIILRIAPLENCSRGALDEEINKLSKGLKEILGKTINITPDIVGDIEYSASGKFKWIISEVSNNSFNKRIH